MLAWHWRLCSASTYAMICSGVTRAAGAIVDRSAAIAHTKAIIIDGDLVVGGSFDYTQAAEQRNVEDVTFTQSREIASRFLANWERRRALSRLYDRIE
jgi:phosphatidylserine/phosphatidylglycerophosphate/cardiolipin synthase-like enzyme